MLSLDSRRNLSGKIYFQKFSKNFGFRDMVPKSSSHLQKNGDLSSKKGRIWAASGD